MHLYEYIQWQVYLCLYNFTLTQYLPKYMIHHQLQVLFARSGTVIPVSPRNEWSWEFLREAILPSTLSFPHQKNIQNQQSYLQCFHPIPFFSQQKSDGYFKNIIEQDLEAENREYKKYSTQSVNEQNGNLKYILHLFSNYFLASRL